MDNRNNKLRSNDEVNIIQLFDYVGRVFDRLFKGLSKVISYSIFLSKKLLLLLLFLINITLKHFPFFIGVNLIAYISLYVLIKNSHPTYRSDIIINQNYNTGNVLYSTIDMLNLIAKGKDYDLLAKELKIPLKTASSLIGFDIKSNMYYNDYHDYYVKHLQTIEDTSYTIPFTEYKELFDQRKFNRQIITVYSNKTNVYDSKLSNGILSFINSNDYFLFQRNNKIKIYEDKIKSIQKILNKSDTLQVKYIRILENFYSKDNKRKVEGKYKKSDINFNVFDSKNSGKLTTKEYELLNEQEGLMMKMITLKDSLDSKLNILNIQKGFSSAVLNDNYYEENKIKIFSIINIILLALFLSKETKVLDLIKKYGSKESFLKLKFLN